MSRKKKNRITVGGNFPRKGQPYPPTIVETQARLFNIDIEDYTQAVRRAKDIDFAKRAKLYDLYEDICMDTHLTSVMEKRVLAVLSSKIEFQRDGKVDDAIGEQIASPWFGRLVCDIMNAKFYGFTLCQFGKKDGWITYELIPRKHVDPVRRLILPRQDYITGHPWDEFSDLLFVGDEKDLGMLAKAAPWVIYKRNDMGDWAQLAEILGIPIQEYTYETDDDKARERCIEDASAAGSLRVLIHSKESQLNLIESKGIGNSSDMHDKIIERCNNEISKLFLGNTLTTETTDKGTQALGTVHQEVEEKKAAADRLSVLNVLNYDMVDIFAAMGVDTKGGKFVFPEPKRVDLATRMNILVQLRTTFGLPIPDDYLYEEFGVEKPENYDELKAKIEGEGKAKQIPTPSKESLEDNPGESKKGGTKNDPTPPKPIQKGKMSLKGWLARFFGKAPRDGAAALRW
jgi:phage gp29-like protein